MIQETVTYGEQPGANVATVEETRPKADDTRAERKRKFFTLMHKRWETARNARREWDANAEDDELFEAGSLSPTQSTHWDQAKQEQYHLSGQPCLTVNKLPQAVHQVTSQARANRPTGTVAPVDNLADKETAEVFQGIGRNIETNSDADVAFTTANEGAARIGRGWVTIRPEFVSDTSFDQDLYIKRILFPRSVYHDPSAVEFDYSDMRYCFRIFRLGKDEFESEYGRSAPSTNDFNDGILTGSLADWAPEGGVTVAHYCWIDYIDDRLIEFTDGTTVLLSEIATVTAEGRTKLAEDGETTIPDASAVKRQRKVRRKQLKEAIVTGIDILEGEEEPPNAEEGWEPVDGRSWPGKRIPYFPCLGEERPIKDKVDVRGIVRDAKDPSRAYDFWVSKLTEKISDELKKPPMVDIRTIAAFKSLWDARNTQNLPYLPVNLEGDPHDPTKTLPWPQAFPPSDPTSISAITVAIRQADIDIQASNGFFDPSLGARSSANQSGVAIARLQQQSGAGASFYQDNLSRCVRSVWRELIVLIPKYYDAARIVRILGLDDQPKTVMVHAGAGKAPTPPQLQAFLESQGLKPEQVQQILAERAEDAAMGQALKKVAGVYDLSAGHYDVTVSTESSYADQRKQDLAILSELWRADPEITKVSGDVAIDNTQLRQKALLIKRLRAMNPALSDDADGPQIPPAVAMKLQQMEQELQALKMEKAAKLLEIESAEKLKQYELEARERMNAATTDATLAGVAAKIDAQLADAMIQREHALLQQFLDHVHSVLSPHVAPSPALPAPSPELAGEPAPSPAGPPAPQE